MPEPERGGARHSASTAGMRKAIVLPVPVLARAMTSPPFSTCAERGYRAVGGGVWKGEVRACGAPGAAGACACVAAASQAANCAARHRCLHRGMQAGR